MIMTKEEYEKLAKVSEEDLANAWTDERGVKYSADRKRLLKAPKELDGEYTVLPGTEVICSYVFSNWHEGKHLTKVLLPEGLKCIGDGVFLRQELEGIEIPDSVEYIGERAFQSCTSLEWVKMGISSHLRSIWDQAFYECTNLKEVYVPDSVVAIRDCAFASCTSLVKVRLGKNWNEHGGIRTFAGCTSIAEFVVAEGHSSVCSKDGIMFSKDMKELIKYPPALPLTSFDVPNSVNRIAGEAFRSCKSLKSVTIPDSVKSIGSSAFRGCTNLTQVNIPSAVTRIDRFTFCACKSLGQVTIPDSVKFIMEKAFWNCTALKSIDIPESVTSIGELAFDGCDALQTINIHGNPVIGKNAFNGCPGYKE